MSPTMGEVEVMRAIGAMERDMPTSWEAPGNWAHIVEGVAALVVRQGDLLDATDLALLLSIGALAHRQSKRPDAAGGAS